VDGVAVLSVAGEPPEQSGVGLNDGYLFASPEVHLRVIRI